MIVQRSHMARVGLGKGWTMPAWTAAPWPVYRVDLVTAESQKVIKLAVDDVVRERVRRALAIAGGVFVPVENRPMRTWSPASAPDVDEFYRAAANATADDAAAVIKLVEQWGTLGVGFLAPSEAPNAIALSEAWETVNGAPGVMGGEASIAPLPARELLRRDSLLATQAALRAFQLRRRRLDELRRQPRYHRPHWRAFVDELGAALFSVHPTHVWDDELDMPRPAWSVQSLDEVLRLRIWTLATAPGQWRKCPCGEVFVSTDPRKIFCDPACARRASAAASYARRKRRATSKGRTERKPQARGR
jgi:hypothetical protein